LRPEGGSIIPTSLSIYYGGLKIGYTSETIQLDLRVLHYFKNEESQANCEFSIRNISSFLFLQKIIMKNSLFFSKLYMALKIKKVCLKIRRMDGNWLKEAEKLTLCFLVLLSLYYH